MTPLTSVHLYMESLGHVEHTDIQNTRSYIEKAVRASERMALFMSTIRKYMQTNATLLHRSEVEVFSVYKETKDVLELLSYQIRQSNAEVTVTLGVPESALLHKGNPLRVYQIISNLILNALQAFSEKSSANHIQIVLNRKIDEISAKPIIQINVIDNGPGIDPTVLNTLFDPFVSGKPESKENIGIGLSTIKQIIEKELLGTIDAASTKGLGTTFTICFPQK